MAWVVYTFLGLVIMVFIVPIQYYITWFVALERWGNMGYNGSLALEHAYITTVYFTERIESFNYLAKTFLLINGN